MSSVHIAKLSWYTSPVMHYSFLGNLPPWLKFVDHVDSYTIPVFSLCVTFVEGLAWRTSNEHFSRLREEVERLWKIDLELYIALEISDIKMTRAHMLYDNRPLESIPVTPIRWEKRWEPEELFRWQRFVWFKDCNIPPTQRHIMHSMALFQWLFGFTHNNFPFCLSIKGLAAL